MVLKMDLKDAYKSVRLSSSKVKRRRGSVEAFRDVTGGAMRGAGATDTEGPDMVGTVAGAELAPQEKVGTETGPETAGKDRAAPEKEGAAGGAERGVVEAAGRVKVEAGG